MQTNDMLLGRLEPVCFTLIVDVSTKITMADQIRKAHQAGALALDHGFAVFLTFLSTHSILNKIHLSEMYSNLQNFFPPSVCVCVWLI